MAPGPQGLGSHGSFMTGSAEIVQFTIFVFSPPKKIVMQRCLYSRSRLQPLKGSPMYPRRQVQTGLWLITLHSALNPQTPGQGSTQCWLTQARVVIQSELMTHSGLQPEYGSPKYSGLQLHMQELPLTLASALAPQGFGLQGSLGGGGAKNKQKLDNFNDMISICC